MLLCPVKFKFKWSFFKGAFPVFLFSQSKHLWNRYGGFETCLFSKPICVSDLLLSTILIFVCDWFVLTSRDSSASLDDCSGWQGSSLWNEMLWPEELGPFLRVKQDGRSETRSRCFGFDFLFSKEKMLLVEHSDETCNAYYNGIAIS